MRLVRGRGPQTQPPSPLTWTVAAIEEPSGALVAWGSCVKGETGSGRASTENQLQQRAVDLPSGSAPACVATGWESTAVALQQGGVLVCGANERNQLGAGVEAPRPMAPCPTPVPGLAARQILSLSCGWRHMAAVDTGGAVMCWGEGRRGALGQGPGVTSVAGPAEVALGSPAQRVACGWQHTLALCRDGSLSAWGCHKHGQCGVGSRAAPARAGPIVWTPAAVHVPAPGPAGGGSDTGHARCVVDVAVGWSHVLVLVGQAAQGGGATLGVLAWGRNTFGQLGTGDREGRSEPTWVDWPSEGAGAPAQVACGSEHSMLVTSTGELYAWGWNEHGNLGVGDREDRVRPARCALPGPVHRVACAGAACFALCGDE